MHPPYICSSVVLVAETDSPVALGIRDELAEHCVRVERAPPGAPWAIEPDVAVALIETPAAIEAIRPTLERVGTRVLVIAGSRRLAEAVLPVLTQRHDLATAAEPADVFLWRLKRLVDRESDVVPRDIDALTGLMSRSRFEAHVRRAIAEFHPERATGVAMLDLDGFKALNDRGGHLAGDEFLRAAAGYLRQSLPPSDVIARLGGDEFGILLTREHPDAVRHAVETVRRGFASVTTPSASDASVGASAGLTFVRAGADSQQLMTEADTALYAAKCAGRDSTDVFGEVAAAATRSNVDLRLQHFENSTRLATERLVEMLKIKSRRLFESASADANFCSLTGLHNRRYFDTQLASEIERSRSHGRELGLALIDLDHFHFINTTYGWPTGDRVLQNFARVLQSTVRATDWTARYGGEEFVVVMPDSTLESARHVVERVRQAFATTSTDSLDGRRVKATLSAGVAQLTEATRSVPELVEEASKALLLAKGAGRNHVQS